MELLGWIGSMLLALCGLPQAIDSFRKKHSDGLTLGFLLMWGGGEIFTLIYLSSKQDILPLIANYSLNLVFLITILCYKFFFENEKFNKKKLIIK